EELLRLTRLCVIVDAGGIQIENLPVQHPLAAANVADAIQQLTPVRAAAEVLELLVIHREALDQVLAQSLGGPDAEPRCDLALDAVADGDDQVEVVERQLAGDLSGT